MSKFDEIVTQAKAPEFQLIEQWAQCHRCLDWTYGMEFYYKDKLLRWTCDEGHVSFVEDFEL